MEKIYNKPSIDFYEFAVEAIMGPSMTQPGSVSVSGTTVTIPDIVAPDPWDD